MRRSRRVTRGPRPGGALGALPSAVLSAGIRAGLVLLLAMPLVVTPGTIYPFVVGKALYARTLIEVIGGLWVVLLLFDSTYRPPRSWVLFAFLGYLAASLLSGLWGVDPQHSLWSDYKRMLGAWDLAHWFLLSVVAASVLRPARSWHPFFNWNLGVVLMASLLALAQTFGVSPLWYLVARCRVDATLGNPSYLAAILMMAILLATGYLVRSFFPAEDEEDRPPAASGASRRGQQRPGRPGERGSGTPRRRARSLLRARLFWVSIVLLGLWVLFLTGTRGALLGLLGGALVMSVAAWIWGNRRLLLPLALAAGGLLVTVGVLFTLDQTVGIPVAPECRGEVTSARLLSTVAPLLGEAADEAGGPERVGFVEAVLGPRLIVAGIGLRAFLDRPLLGWGQENFARAFDRFAEVSLYRYGVVSYDQAHNKIVEELATKGILGTMAYLGLWGALVWAVVRRRRPVREEALAYAVLGALGGYFLQNLFLFDTPGMLLQWALLVGWVAAQERAPQPAVSEQGRGVGSTRAASPLRRSGPQAVRPAWAAWSRGVAALVALVVVGLGIYLFNYRPYTAAQKFLGVKRWEGYVTLQERFSLAEEGFATFSGMATLPRQELLAQLADEGDSLSPGERRLAIQFSARQAALVWETEPRNARVLAAAFVIPQAEAPSPQAMEQLDPVLRRLQELAPERLYTHQFWANQELLKGNYREAIRIAEAFHTRAPGTEGHFRPITEAAKRALGVTQ